MFFTGCLCITGSYSVSLPLSGGAYWDLLRPTSEIFAIPPRAPEVAVPSDQWNGGVLSVPFARTSTRQARACSVVGPSVWNGLSLALRLLPGFHSFINSLINSFILETYVAPLQDTTTQRRSQSSHGQRRRT